MINVALLSVIRRWHLRDGMSIREISRRTGLSRNTVRKYLTNGVVEPKYPARTVANKLDAFASKLEGWLNNPLIAHKEPHPLLRTTLPD